MLNTTLNRQLNKFDDEGMSSLKKIQVQENFEHNAVLIYQKHFSQSAQDVLRLQNKYSAPVFGEKSMIDHLERLSLCIDPSDTDLYCTSQLTHALQVAEAMEVDGLGEDWVVLGLIHDLGKLLLLTDESDENIVCPNEVVDEFSQFNSGLDSCVINWGHDEFAYQCLQGLISDDFLWVIRYHSLRFDRSEAYLSESDRLRYKEFLVPFRYYDLSTKSPFFKPKKSLCDYRELLEHYFPHPVII